MPAEFIISAARPDQFPREEAPEVAFLGRSNVGKSSLLNRLLRECELARTSSKPGCTQWINFYRAEDGLLFVDLPGYGFARVPPDRQRGWQALIESYLLHRKSLNLSFLLLDARRGWMDKDLELKQWLEFHQRRYVVIATKFDKLKTQRDRNQSMVAIRERLAPDAGPVMFSAMTGQGVTEIWQAIRSIKTNP
jgi:GTP-binding protein